MEEVKNNQIQDTETPLDKNVRLMSPTQMVVRRFFRSRLSIIGMIMVVGLFLFSFVGPLFVAELPHKEIINGVEVEAYDPSNNQWGETELDRSGKVEYATSVITYTVNGESFTVTDTKPGTIPVELDVGDVLDVHVEVTYLSGYFLERDGSAMGFPKTAAAAAVGDLEISCQNQESCDLSAVDVHVDVVQGLGSVRVCKVHS